MGLEIRRQFFVGRAGVLDDLRETGFWPTTYVSVGAPEVGLHWHAHEAHAYIVEGRTSMIDGETGERHAVGPGDKIVVPARTLHAEGEVTERVVYILAAPDALPPDEFLAQHAPAELES